MRDKQPKPPNPSNKTEVFILKLFLIPLVGLLVLVGAGLGIKSVYVHWQERRLVASADALLQKGDYQDARKVARTARELNPESTPAFRILASVAERLGDRGAITFRGRLAELQPGSEKAQLDWARAALQFDELALAERVLGKIENASAQTAAYHDVAAELARARDDYAGAELHLAAAAALEPSDFSHQVKLAILQLRSPDEVKRDQAREKLATLQNQPSVRREASRALLNDAVSHQKMDTAVQIADRIETYPEKTLADRLDCLAALQKAKDPRFTAQLATLSVDPAVRKDYSTVFINWMISNNLATDALQWAATLDVAAKNRPALNPVLARAYVAAGDWPGLERFGKDGDWTDREFLRHAYLARALREQKEESAFREEWNAAVKGAPSGDALAQLAQLVSDWGWDTETTELFWRVADNQEMRGWALRTLYRHYSGKGDTAGLYKVILRMATTQPDDLDAQNNVAQLSLLLGMNVQQAHQIASRLYEKNPANPVFVSTYAFSRYVQDDKKTARTLMDALPKEQQRQPAIAAYYAIILAGNGDREKAREFLALAENAPLLPEERALVANAQRIANGP